MKTRMLTVLAALLVVTAGGLLLAACGGSSSSSSNNGGGGGGGSVANTVPVSVNLGPTQNYANGIFVSVHICTPGSTTDCQDIPDVLVDTGSYGLRLLASKVNLNLPETVDSSNQPIGECTQFQATYTWGPIATVDLTMAGETASKLPIQLLGVSGFPAAPASCSNSGLTENDSLTTLGANGILGIGVFRHDCGTGCSGTPAQAVYFSCPSSGCTNPASVALADQVQNPVWLFAQDNNGIALTLPAVPDAGALTVAGTLTFGIGTQNDNALGSATVMTANPYDGTIATQYPAGSSGTIYCSSQYYTGCTGYGTIIDSGSNGNFFLDSSTLTGMPTCASYPGFYCPSSTTAFTATNGSVVVQTGQSKAANWNVANTDNLFNNNPTYAAFNNLAGPNPGAFDFGLPFFFGKTIFVGINQMTAGSDTGPFFAY